MTSSTDVRHVTAAKTSLFARSSVRVALTLALISLAPGWVLAGDVYVAVLEDTGTLPGGPRYAVAVLASSQLTDSICYSLTSSSFSAQPIGATLHLSEDRPGIFSELRPGAGAGCFRILGADHDALRSGAANLEIHFPESQDVSLFGRVAFLRPGSDAGSGWERLEAVLLMDEEQWRVLEFLLRLDGDGWTRLDELISSNGSARIYAGGVAHPDDDIAGGILVDLPTLQRVMMPAVDPVTLDDVHTAVVGVSNQVSSLSNQLGSARNAILNRINNLNIDGIRTRVENLDSLIQNLFGNVQDAVWLNPAILTRLKDTTANLAETLLESLEDAVDLMGFLRDGFAAFKGTDCEATSPCGMFRQDLKSAFADLKTLRDFAFTVGIDNPDLRERALAFDSQFAEDLIDRAPPIVLYLLSRVLETAMPGWQSLLPTAVAQIPPELSPAAAVLSPASKYWSEGGTNPPTVPVLPDAVEVGLQDRICQILLFRSIDVKTIDGYLKLLRLVFKVVANQCPADLNFGGNVVGEGVSGTITAHPCNSVMQTIDNVLDKIIESLSDRVGECEKAQFQRAVLFEAQLATCTPLPGLMLPSEHGGQLEGLLSHMSARVIQFQEAGLPVGDAVGLVDDAEASVEAGDYAEAFSSLCAVYTEMFPTFGNPGGANPPTGPPGAPGPPE